MSWYYKNGTARDAVVRQFARLSGSPLAGAVSFELTEELTGCRKPVGRKPGDARLPIGLHTGVLLISAEMAA
jgi:hypothetical protein